MKRMAEIFRGSIVDVTDKTYTIELTGNENKFLAFLTAMMRIQLSKWLALALLALLGGEKLKSLNLLKEKYMNVLYDRDAKEGLIKEKKVVIIGYGSQGHAHALNLSESGVNVCVGLRKNSASWAKAQKAGMVVKYEAVKDADIVMLLMPDETISAVYAKHIESEMKEGSCLGFAHEFNIHYGQVVPRKRFGCNDGAPKAPGHTVRSHIEPGGGVPCLTAVGRTLLGLPEMWHSLMLVQSVEARQALLKLHLEMKPRQIYLVSRLFCVEGLLS